MTAPMRVQTPQQKADKARFDTEQLYRRPMPVAAATSGAYPMSYDGLPYDAFAFGPDGEGSPFWSGTPTKNNAYLNGFYVQDTGLNHSFLSYFRIGPQGSRWEVNLLADVDTDCGQITFSWQVIPETAGVIDGASLRPPTTYYTAATPTTDLYSAAPGSSFTTRSLMIVGGADGTLITANATGETFNGGAGIWAMQTKITGKNASSSNYRARLEAIWVRRVTSDGFPAG